MNEASMEKKNPRKIKIHQGEEPPEKKDEIPYEDVKVHSHSYAQEVELEIQARKKYKIIEEVNGEEINMTPKKIPIASFDDKFTILGYRVVEQMDKLLSIASARSTTTTARGRSSARMLGLTSMKQSIEELINGVAQEKIIFNSAEHITVEQEYVPTPYTKPFIKIVLRKTEDYLLFSQSSGTAARGTNECDEVEKDNRYYDFITIGKGKVRRRSQSEAQTVTILQKSRGVNTRQIVQATVGCFVSNFEMYDTLHDLLSKTSIGSQIKLMESGISQPASRLSTIGITTDDTTHKSITHESTTIYATAKFQHAKMLMGRAISSNIHEDAMKRFRNFVAEDRFSEDATYTYDVELLFRCIPAPSAKERKPVADICFCPTNGDIFAVAYGIYTFSSHHVPQSGDMFIWSIKNPGEPERAFYYPTPVTAVRFSPYIPSLVAIGLFNGCVEVRDITQPHDSPIAISQRSTSPNCTPVVAIRWMKQTESNDANEIDPFLCLAQDGSVTRYSIIRSPYLLGFNQMTLERIEGQPEGIETSIVTTVKCEANRNPQGLNLITHPQLQDIYYVLTDEGCIHKCSTNYQHQYLEVLRCHEGGVLCMEFSPWSPKLFLTCGNDWCVRVWIEGIFKPLIELNTTFLPVHYARWSPTHSTIILSLTRSDLEIWDIARNTLKPMASHEMDSSYSTMFTFSKCGRTVLVGNERGNVLFQALNQMPFPPYFQYDELEKAIYKAVGNDQELMIELKSIGFFGYHGKHFMQSD